MGGLGPRSINSSFGWGQSIHRSAECCVPCDYLLYGSSGLRQAGADTELTLNCFKIVNNPSIFWEIEVFRVSLVLMC